MAQKSKIIYSNLSFEETGCGIFGTRLREQPEEFWSYFGVGP
jgi:hypothetical protein